MKLHEEQSFWEYLKMAIFHNTIAGFAFLCIIIGITLIASDFDLYGIILWIISIPFIVYSRWFGRKREKKGLY